MSAQEVANLFGIDRRDAVKLVGGDGLLWPEFIRFGVELLEAHERGPSSVTTIRIRRG